MFNCGFENQPFLRKLFFLLATRNFFIVLYFSLFWGSFRYDVNEFFYFFVKNFLNFGAKSLNKIKSLSIECHAPLLAPYLSKGYQDSDTGVIFGYPRMLKFFDTPLNIRRHYRTTTPYLFDFQHLKLNI